jgi:tRNA(Met) C34 N-acetyltransferase TmcA
MVTLSRPQSLAHRALQRGNTVCIPWGRGCGKSYFVRLVWYLLIEQWDGRFRPGAPHRGVRIVLLMPTLEQAKKVHLKLLQDEIDEAYGKWRHLGLKINKQDWRITAPGGSWIQWVTAERATNIRGMRCDLVCIDEADDVDIEVHEAIVDPWFSEHHSLGMTLIGGTPTRGRYGLLYKTHRHGIEAAPNHYSFPHLACILRK